jgi:hypothetical protein
MLFSFLGLLLQVHAANAAAREAARARGEAHRVAKVENKRRLALAEEQLQEARAALSAANQAALQAAWESHQVREGYQHENTPT